MQPFWATELRQLTHTWLWIPSAVSLKTGSMEKDYYAAATDYCDGILHGIVKIASKMGISTIQSYMGAQIFEAVGIGREVIDTYFTNTVSRVGGITLSDIERDIERRHTRAFDPLGLNTDMTLDSDGIHKERSGKEDHLFNPRTIHMIQRAVRENDYEKYKKFCDMVQKEARPGRLRNLMDFDMEKARPIPIDQVESAENIVKRFKTAAMSYGALSEEAHRDDGHCHEPDRRKVKHRRGGRTPRPLRNNKEQRHKAGGLCPVRRHGRVSFERQGNTDKDGTGGKAWRGRTAPGQKGLSGGGRDKIFHSRRGAYFPAAAPRYIFN